jgi:hypothetical protein
MMSRKYSTVVAVLAIFANAVAAGSLTAPKGAKVLTVGVIGGMLHAV